jgi:hypothetical protein
MARLTRGQFSAIAQSKVGYSGLRGYVNESRTFSKSVATTSIFLSHSHHDKDVVEQAKIFFENLGIKIYVDWADETMPERTTGVTATKIKNQIIALNDKFVLLATNNAVDSKWCNWEVGIADPFKFPPKKFAILPLADNSGTWKGNEYLQIYPRIELNPRQTGGEGYYVWYPDNTWETIEQWLNK